MPTNATDKVKPSSPSHRRLQVFSLDPSADVQFDNALVSRSVLRVPWEEDLTTGPVGEYLEVVDVDPASGCVYDPVDLNDSALLAQDGLPPSTGNPQFHQQMVYAVGMKTIANFEQVLGRKVIWAERRYDEGDAKIDDPAASYVRRLRLYPHALREDNAYYSPSKAALLFGYFNATTTDPREELPGGLVFSCLSHDIVAHEMTHAILDGMHRRLLEPSNPDMLAFHEAFADIVAIFQHFTLPGLLLDQIQKTRGNLRSNILLAQLAVQFARSTGRGQSLRNALGADGPPRPADPTLLGRTFEPHERGAILVAAVFNAFVHMYENRVADLRRIATGGTGVLPDGDVHPDLARRFAEEAVRLSQRVLNMCIRAVDYLPPVDVTFGDFLRALVTADADFYPDDEHRHRLAFIEAFRDRGIYPLDVRTLAEDALRWKRLEDREWSKLQVILPPPAVLCTMAAAYDSAQMNALAGNRVSVERATDQVADAFSRNDFDRATTNLLKAAWLHPEEEPPADQPNGRRFPQYIIERTFASFLRQWIQRKAKGHRRDKETIDHIGWHLGLDLKGLASLRPRRTKDEEANAFEVHTVRPTVRVRVDGRSKIELLIVLGQKVRKEIPDLGGPGDPAPTFMFRGGSTLIVDPELGRVTYSVNKNILSESRLARQTQYLRDQIAQQGSAALIRFGLTPEARVARRRLEPFAVAHGRSEPRGTY
jgi:hypothetical protein